MFAIAFSLNLRLVSLQHPHNLVHTRGKLAQCGVADIGTVHKLTGKHHLDAAQKLSGAAKMLFLPDK